MSRGIDSFPWKGGVWFGVIVLLILICGAYSRIEVQLREMQRQFDELRIENAALARALKLQMPEPEAMP